MSKPIVSIITVCYQAKEALNATIQNILEQDFLAFEYLVIDGGSTDGSKELLEEASLLFAKKTIPFRFLSEADKGIYDAMNKGTTLAQGNWLLFLNAGDLLAEHQVLQQIFKTPPEADILYGDTLCTYQGQKKRYPALPLKNLAYEMAFCHQSVFIRKELLLQHPYDISYRVCADHEFFLSMYLQNKSFSYQAIPISIYEIAGFSDKNKLLAHREQHRMQKELGIFRFSFSWLSREICFYIKQSLKSLFGQKLIDWIRKNRLH